MCFGGQIPLMNTDHSVSITDCIWLEAQSPFFPLAWQFKKEVWTMEVCS